MEKWTDWVKCEGDTILVKAIPPNCVAIELEFRGRERQTIRHGEPTTEWTDLNLSSGIVAYRLLLKPESSIELFPTRFEAYDPATKDLLFTIEAFDEGAATLNMVGCLTPRNIDEVLEQMRTAFDALKLK